MKTLAPIPLSPSRRRAAEPARTEKISVQDVSFHYGRMLEPAVGTGRRGGVIHNLSLLTDELVIEPPWASDGDAALETSSSC